MRIRKSGLLIAAGIAIAACSSFSVSEPSVCDTANVSFPISGITVPTGDCSTLPDISLPALTSTTSVDFSSTINKITDGGIPATLSLSISSLTIDNTSGEFDWVHSVSVLATGTNLPQVPFASYTMSGPALTEIPIVVSMSANEVLQYLESGPVSLQITLQADTVSACTAQTIASMTALNSTVNVCVAANANFTKTF